MIGSRLICVFQPSAISQLRETNIKITIRRQNVMQLNLRTTGRMLLFLGHFSDGQMLWKSECDARSAYWGSLWCQMDASL